MTQIKFEYDAELMLGQMEAFEPKSPCVPSVGDKINLDGKFYSVIERVFFFQNDDSLNYVQIHLGKYVRSIDTKPARE